MAYCTISDLRAAIPNVALVGLTDDPGTGQLDESKVNAVIADADGEIDTYLAERYTVPLTTVPTMVKRCSVDMATYHLYKRRYEEIPETRRMAYKDALRLLEQVAAGKIKLPLSGVDTGDFASGVLVSSHFGDD